MPIESTYTRLPISDQYIFAKFFIYTQPRL